MKRLVTLFFPFLLLCTVLPALCSSGSSISMYEGRHFWLGFMQNEAYRYVSEPLYLRVYIATKRPSKVTLNTPWNTTRNYAINGDTILTLGIDPSVEVRISERPVREALEFISDEPITMYALSSMYLSSDAYAVIPTDSWGMEYFAMCMSNDTYNAPQKQPVGSADSVLLKIPRLGECMVLAAEDSTTVCYTPVCPTAAGVPAGETRTVVLNRGECFLIASAPGIKNTNDLTGTYVTSDKPVGFLSGHMRTSIPHLPDAMAGEYDTKDHLIEMLPPVNYWGTEYVSAPLGVCVAGDYFRVMAASDGTTIKVETELGVQTVSLDRGEFAEFEFVASPARWQADKPILLGQYMYSDYLDPDTKADPCFVILPPLDRFVQRAIFQAPSTVDLSQFDRYYIHVICTADALAGLRMNSDLLIDLAPELILQTIGSSDLHWARLQVHPSKLYKLTTPTGRFSGIVYAHGAADSYGFPLGTSYLLDGPVDSIAPVVTASGTCGTITGTITDNEPDASGLFEVYADSTDNYILTKDTMSDTSTVIGFSARPDDPYRDARMTIVAVDRAGNQTSLRFTYKAPSISFDSTLTLPIIPEGNTTCTPALITNTGDSSLIISGVFDMGDSRVTLKNIPAFPLTLDPGETLTFEVCYTATDDTSAVKAQILFRYGCQLQKWIRIAHTTEQPVIATTGWDFGDVRVGDTTCADILIINRGNTSILLTELSPLHYPDFTFPDTAGIFPYVLKVNDTLRVRVCFTPAATERYEEHIEAANNYSLSTDIPITGNGVAPDIVVENIHWYNRRTGTHNDSLLTITNRGTGPAVISLLSSPDTDPPVLGYPIEKLFPLYLPPDSSISVPVYFAPDQPQHYLDTIFFGIDWRLHPPVYATLEGTGTLPAIEVFDIDFDTVLTGTFRDTTLLTMRSSGNELLTVDTLFFAGGDISSFVLPEQSRRGRTIATGSASPFSARFIPSSAGEHRAIVAVVHDARERYERDTAYFVLVGFAARPDTINIVSTINTGEVYACQSNIFSLTFDNSRSNRALQIDSMQVQLDGIDTTLYFPALTVAAKQSVELPVFTLNPEADGIFTMTTRLYYHQADDPTASPAVHITQREISIRRSVLSLDTFEEQTIVPWDEPVIHIHGTITGGHSVSGALSLDIAYNYQSFRPLNNTAELVIAHNNGRDTLRLPAALTEHRNGLHIAVEPFGAIVLPASWSLSLPLFVFLDTLATPQLGITISSDGCLLGDEAILPLRLTGVCSYNYRSIRYLPVVSTSVYPNPASEEATVEVSLPADETVSISLVDALGRSFPVREKMYLKKGKYSYKLLCADFNSGIYSLVVSFSNSVRQHHFIIIK